MFINPVSKKMANSLKDFFTRHDKAYALKSLSKYKPCEFFKKYFLNIANEAQCDFLPYR